MAKVFISHQAADAMLSRQISDRLRNIHGIDTYLDVIDSYLLRRGEDLAAHIRAELGKCTQLLAVVSAATRTSWWVPWEIGVATEKNQPLATYAAGYSSIDSIPEYLRKWPYLRSEQDLDRYAAASKHADRTFSQKSVILTESVARTRSTAEFFQMLRGSLGQ